MADESTGELVTQSGAYGIETEDLLYRVSLNDATSSSVRVFRSGEALFERGRPKRPVGQPHVSAPAENPFLIVAPLGLEGRSIGVIRVGSRRKDLFRREHLDLVRAIADEAAVLIQTAMLNRRSFGHGRPAHLPQSHEGRFRLHGQP